MNGRVFWAGALLVALGSLVVLWKAIVLETPLLPSAEGDLWQVELGASVRGEGERGSVTLALPVSRPGQRIFGDDAQGDGLDVTRRKLEDGREAVFAGRIEGVKRVAYRFRARRYQNDVRLPVGPLVGALPEGDAPNPVGSTHSDEAQRETPAAFSLLYDELDLPPASDFAGRVRSLYAFATHEITLSPTAGDDPLLALREREANAFGKELLLCELLRGAGATARVVRGLELGEGRAHERTWTEVWNGEHWFGMSASLDFFGEVPRTLLAVSTGADPLVEATGVVSLGRAYHALRVPLTEAELGALAAPSDPWFSRLSLYGLPLATQSALRLLLLLPLGVLAIAILRNIIGVPGYGTFMPMLLALALAATELTMGLILIVVVLGIGIIGRMMIERLHLLLVPRLGIILCLVVMAIAVLALLGRGFDRSYLYTGGLFPIVILAMLVERFSIKAAEEGLRTALLYAGYSIGVAVMLFPIFRSAEASHLMFGFPELVLVVMGFLVWTGGYTGYRVSDWLRFAPLVREENAS